MRNPLRRSEFIKNILTLISGNMVAQLIPLLAEPVLTRLFLPREFGLLAVFISITTLFNVIATGRYELAIMLPEREKNALNLVGVSVITSLFVGIISLLVVWIFNDPICRLLKSEEISGYLYFVPFVVVFAGLFQTFNYWFSRRKDFGKISAARIVQSGTNAASGIGTGFLGLGTSGLILSQILGHVLSAIYFVFRFLQSDRKKLNQIGRSDMKMLASRYSEFPKVNALFIFSDTAQYSGISFLIAYFFSNTLLGFYSRTFRILTVPLSFIGSAIAYVFYQKASEVYREKGDLQKLSIQTLLGTSAIGLPIFIVFMIWGPELFAFVLGAKWYVAGEYARILSPWFFVKFVSFPLTQVPVIVNRQRQMFLLSIISIVSIFASLVYGGTAANNIETGFYLISISQVVFHIFMIAWMLRIANNKYPGS